MACIDDARTLYWTDPTFPWLHSVYVSIAWYERGFDRGGGQGAMPTSFERGHHLIPVLGSQPTDDVSHEPSGRLPLLSARPAVTPATLKRAATNFAAW